MKDVKEAVAIALRFVANVYEDEALRDPRLEEVELSEDGVCWYVTLSFLRESTAATAAERIARPESRDYKVVSIHSSTGDVRSMKIREPV